MYRLEEETEADWWEVEALYDLCFAPGRTALSSYRLRDGVPKVPELCLTLRDADGILAAVIRYWPVRVGGRRVLLLGPVAVHPTRQGEGLGGLLMRESLAEAARLGFRRLLVPEACHREQVARTKGRGSGADPDCELVPIREVAEAVDWLERYGGSEPG